MLSHNLLQKLQVFEKVFGISKNFTYIHDDSDSGFQVLLDLYSFDTSNFSIMVMVSFPEHILNLELQMKDNYYYNVMQ